MTRFLRNDRRPDRDNSENALPHVSGMAGQRGTWQKTRCGRALAEVLERQVDDYPGPSGEKHSRDTAGSLGRARDSWAPFVPITYS